MNKEIKLGLIGGGYWGKNLIRDFYSLGVLDTICDINEDMLVTYSEQYNGINTTTNWQTVLDNKNITAVCISLPADLHHKFAKSALLHDKDVYVEKPITLSTSDAEELIKLAKINSKILMVGHLLHYHPAVEKIKDMVNGGEIGKIKNIISNRLNLGKFRTAENVLWSFAPHDISVVLSLCGNRLPDRVVCTGKDYITKSVHDITNTTMFFDDLDIYVNINVNWLNPYKEQKLVIIGEDGMIVFDDTKKEDRLVIYRNYLERNDAGLPTLTKSEPEIIDTNFEFPLVRECRHFIECCQNRLEPITNGEEGLRVIKVLNASHKSLTSGKVVNLENQVDYFVHPTSIVDTGAKVGSGTKIWHYSHISSNCEIGKNCNIGQNVFIAPNVKIGDGCKIQNNVSVYSGVECEDYVFLGPSCVLTNDINPRAEHSKGGAYMCTLIKRGATIGANATVVCGNTIGAGALIGAGAVVTKDVEANAIIVGNPGKVIGSIDEYGNRTLLKN